MGANKPSFRFTPSELELIRLLAAGKKPVEIARKFRCSDSAVSQWRKAARDYAKVQTDAQLVAFAVREGFIG